MAERELGAMRAEESRLEGQGGSAGYGSLGLKEAPKTSIEYLRAASEVRYQQTLLDLLIRQYDAATLDESKDAAVIQVVEPAIAPEHKSFPQRAQLTMLLTFLGFVAGCSWVLAVSNWRAHPEWQAAFSELRAAAQGK
jgi:hypothetical protein